MDDEIADLFHDDEEITGSKSMMIVKSYDDDSDIVDVAKKRKFNSFRSPSDKSRSSLGDIAEMKVVKEFKSKGNNATVLPPNRGQSGIPAEENKRQSFFMNLKGTSQHIILPAK